MERVVELRTADAVCHVCENAEEFTYDYNSVPDHEALVIEHFALLGWEYRQDASHSNGYFWLCRLHASGAAN